MSAIFTANQEKIMAYVREHGSISGKQLYHLGWGSMGATTLVRDGWLREENGPPPTYFTTYFAAKSL